MIDHDIRLLTKVYKDGWRGSNKILYKKRFGYKRILVKKNFGLKKILSKKIDLKNVWFQKIF